MTHRVVDLNKCRDLLGNWSKVRDRIVAGKVSAIAVCIRDDEGHETVALCGDYSANPVEALKASMRMSMELTKDADFRASR